LVPERFSAGSCLSLCATYFSGRTGFLFISSRKTAAGVRPASATARRYFIGGSDARIIMGSDESALIRLWREKRGEVEPEELSTNLVVQLGVATEELNRRWYQANTGQLLTDIGRRIRHPILRWMAATLDGRVAATEAVFEAKFMLPWAFSEETAAEKHMAQLQHNMWWSRPDRRSSR
jgi:predicted phage-related endonuclease